MMTSMEFLEILKGAKDGNDFEKKAERYYYKKSFHRINTKAMRTTNLVINFVIAAFCIFVLDLRLWQLALAYVGTDIVLMGLEFLVLKYYTAFYVRVLRGSAHKEKYKKLVKELFDTNMQLMNKYKNDEIRMDYNEVGALREELADLNVVMEEFEKQEREQQQAKLAEENISSKKEKESLDFYRSRLSQFSQLDISKLSVRFKGYINKVLEDTRILLDELEKNPSAFDLVKGTFNIYLMEVIEVINQVGMLNQEQQVEYESTLQQVLEQYEKHIKRMLDRVHNFNSNSVTINLNTLLETLKKEGE